MLDNLQPAAGSVKGKKRIGRGQGSGTGKTAGRGHKGQKARSGGKSAVGFEGGQQPIYKRLPKVGFTSKIVKPFAVSVDRFAAVKEMAEISVEALIEAGIAPKATKKVKLIGTGAKELVSKIKDENVTTSGK